MARVHEAMKEMDRWTIDLFPNMGYGVTGVACERVDWFDYILGFTP